MLNVRLIMKICKMSEETLHSVGQNILFKLIGQFCKWNLGIAISSSQIASSQFLLCSFYVIYRQNLQCKTLSLLKSIQGFNLLLECVGHAKKETVIPLRKKFHRSSHRPERGIVFCLGLMAASPCVWDKLYNLFPLSGIHCCKMLWIAEAY